MSAATVGEWVAFLDRLFPASWAEDWDNSGLQTGDPRHPVERILVALDPTLEVVREAARLDCRLLVTHHPLLFRPLSALDASTPVAATVHEAIASRVSIVACHTNADVASPGVSDALAAAMGVEVTGVLSPTHAGARAKLVTFVPADATMKVLDAVAEAGAGVIGEYRHCSFRVRGTGTFLPSERANPAIGERGELTEAEEDRLEVVAPRDALPRIVDALRAAHPYEEVAYDVLPLLGATGLGLGRVARAPEPMTVEELAARAAERLAVAPRVAGDLRRSVSTIALCGGSAASLIPDAVRAGADAFVTGDVKHHQALDAIAAGLAVVDAGHHGTEWPFVGWLAERLRQEDAPAADVVTSETTTDPFRAVSRASG